MKVGRTGLKLHTGKIIHFSSPEARDKYEMYNQARKHGWVPKNLKRRNKK